VPAVQAAVLQLLLQVLRALVLVGVVLVPVVLLQAGSERRLLAMRVSLSL
jgi:hypothetical protein